MLTQAQKLAGLFKLAALADVQLSGGLPTEEALQSESLARLSMLQGGPKKEMAREPQETIVPVRAPTT